MTCVSGRSREPGAARQYDSLQSHRSTSSVVASLRATGHGFFFATLRYHSTVPLESLAGG